MITKKICMLGAYGVGKTSLVRQFVHSIFSEKYQITIGVKIDKKILEKDGRDVKLMLWDIAGEEDRFSIPTTYLTGAAGVLLVVDGTRIATFHQALDIHERVVDTLGEVPCVMVLNKCDLSDQWELDGTAGDQIRQGDRQVVHTSARLGTGVEEAFSLLVDRMVPCC